MILNGERIALHDGMLLIISPYQHQEWHCDDLHMGYTFLVFQEEFINNFFTDKYFMYRLLTGQTISEFVNSYKRDGHI